MKFKLSIDEYSEAIKAAYREGYIQGSQHRRGDLVMDKARQLAELFWRVCEKHLEERLS